MKFTFTTKRANVSDDLKQYAMKKIGKLERYFKKDSEAYVSFSTERGRDTVEITIQHGSMYFRSRQMTQDFYASIDASIDALVRQIHKNKTRLEKRLRTGAFERDVASVNSDMDDLVETPDVDLFALPEEKYDIIRTKRFAVKPISPDEAILQMNMLGHEFFLFRDLTNNESFAVVYRRNDGGYGLIETI